MKIFTRLLIAFCFFLACPVAYADSERFDEAVVEEALLELEPAHLALSPEQQTGSNYKCLISHSDPKYKGKWFEQFGYYRRWWEELDKDGYSCKRNGCEAPQKCEVVHGSFRTVCKCKDCPKGEEDKSED